MLEQGLNVRCIIRPSRRELGWLGDLPVEIARAEMSDVKAVENIVKDAQYIFHIAGVTKAKKRSEYFKGNVEVTKTLLEAATKNTHLKKFCHISSLSAVGPSYDGLALDENAACRPVSVYGISKYQAEEAVRSYMTKLPIVIIRPPTVYGPRDTDVLEMFRWVNRGILPIIGNTDKTLSLIHVRDLARGIIAAALSDKTNGETYFISNQQVYSFSTVIGYIGKILEKKRARTVRIPVFLLYAVAGATQLASQFSKKPSIVSLDKAKELLEPHWICSGEKIKKHLGFETSIPLEEGLKTTLDWYRKYGWI